MDYIDLVKVVEVFGKKKRQMILKPNVFTNFFLKEEPK